MDRASGPTGEAMTLKNEVASSVGTSSASAASLTDRWVALAPYFLSVLRIAAAFLFMEYGTAKLFAFPAALLPGGGTAPLASLPGIAGLLETVGGLLLLLGLFTRPVAFLLSGQMAIAYWFFHAPHGFWPILNHGDPAVLFCFIWLYVSAAGAGPWSIDALRWRSSARAG
ncbi:MAG TPA: DoxX family protein [Polyangiaceae bacterium]